MKSSSTNDMLFVNGKFMGSVQHGEDFTVYVSPMMTYSKERFTKHYYTDGERVSSRIGSGQFSNKFDQAINPVITAGNQNYVRRMALLNNESSKELVKKYNLPPGPATNKGIYEKLLLEGRLDAVENPNYVAPEETTYDIPRGWPKYPVFPDSGAVPGPPIQFEELKPDSVKAGYTFTDPNMIGEVDEYFYHGDHISSVVLVTDKKAKVVQQFAYMPFGELLVDNSTVDLDYRFSAKENDRESGLGYFGARYYDNTSAMWLGVDPLWEKYAGMNPYNYCAGNPVMLVDPDGSSVFYNENGDYVGTDDKGYEGHIYITSQIDFDNYNKKYLCPMETQTLTPEAYSKIYTDVLKKMGINTSTLYNGKISVKGVCVKFDLIDGFTMNYSYNNPSMNVRYLSTSMDTNTEKGIKIQVNQLSDEVKNELCTVENVFNSLGIHEYNGHGINRYGDYAKNHHKVYESQILDPSFGKTTQKYKDHVLSNYYHYLKKENVGYSGDNYRKIYNLYEKNK